MPTKEEQQPILTLQGDQVREYERMCAFMKSLNHTIGIEKMISRLESKMRGVSDNIRRVNIPSRELDPRQCGAIARDSALKDVCESYELWAMLYQTWASMKVYMRQMKEDGMHELDDRNVFNTIDDVKRYYDDAQEFCIDGGIPDQVQNEVKVAIYESCRNPRTSAFPFRGGDSMSREIVSGYLEELRLHGLPFREKNCTDCGK